MSTISRRSAMVGATLALALVAAGCSKADTGSDSPSAGSSSAAAKLNVVFIPKNLGNPYFDASDAGGKKAVETLGGKFSEVGPQTASPDPQVQYINTAAQQKVSAIVISANDPTAIGSALQQAKTAGTKVVTFDSDTEAQSATCSSTRPRPRASPRPRSTASPSRSVTPARSPSSRRRPTRRTRTPG